MKKETSRRNFIKLAAATGIAAGSVRVTPAARRKEYLIETDLDQQQSVSPNDKIRLATIGIGGQGSGDTSVALRVPGVELVAVADVYDGRLRRAQEVIGKQLFTTRDYREILTRPDVDAVIVATPDHWHAQVSVDAMNAGKHVYCEKPMVRVVEEGMRMIETQRKTGKILQVGSQRVSSIIYRKAKELYDSKVIGQLTMVEAFLDRNSALGAWQYSIPPDASPQTVDWDRFIGSAPKREFEPIRLFRWRNYQDYGTGVPGDLFVHLFSGVHYVLGSIGPTRVMATGGIRYWKDGRDVPDVMLGLYDYPATAAHPAFNMAFKVNFADGAGEDSVFRFVGSDGVLIIGGNGVTLMRKAKQKEPGYTIDTFPKDVQEQFLKEYRSKYPPSDNTELVAAEEENYNAPRNYNDSFDHFRNFFNAIRTNSKVVEDAAFGFRAAGPALLSNRSYFENKVFGWNPEQMKITSS